MGPFPKLEGGKHQVGSDAEVGISIRGEKDQSGRYLGQDTFPGSNACLLILLRCSVCFFSVFCGRGKKYTLDPLYSLRYILVKFEVSPQPFEPVFTLIRESRFNSFCWAVWIVWFILVGSHSSELRIDHRLFC